MRKLLLAMLLLLVPAAVAQKKAPDLSGHWKLDPLASKGDTSQNSAITITQSDDEVRFDYFKGVQPSGSEIFTTDGRERKRSASRQGTSYAKARWDKKDLDIITRTFLDYAGSQSYTEYERWSLSPDSQKLTCKTGDSTLVYTREKQSEEPR